MFPLVFHMAIQGTDVLFWKALMLLGWPYLFLLNLYAIHPTKVTAEAVPGLVVYPTMCMGTAIAPLGPSDSEGLAAHNSSTSQNSQVMLKIGFHLYCQ